MKALKFGFAFFLGLNSNQIWAGYSEASDRVAAFSACLAGLRARPLTRDCNEFNEEGYLTDPFVPALIERHGSYKTLQNLEAIRVFLNGQLYTFTFKPEFDDNNLMRLQIGKNFGTLSDIKIVLHKSFFNGSGPMRKFIGIASCLKSSQTSKSVAVREATRANLTQTLAFLTTNLKKELNQLGSSISEEQSNRSRKCAQAEINTLQSGFGPADESDAGMCTSDTVHSEAIVRANVFAESATTEDRNKLSGEPVKASRESHLFLGNDLNYSFTFRHVGDATGTPISAERAQKLIEQVRSKYNFQIRHLKDASGACQEVARILKIEIPRTSVSEDRLNTPSTSQ